MGKNKSGKHGHLLRKFMEAIMDKNMSGKCERL